MPSHVGIDIGGTSMDMLLLDDATGRTHSLKVSSGDGDMAATIGQGLRDLLQKAGIGPGDVRTIVHGAPEIAPGAAGAPVGLLVTRGFEHVLHLGDGSGAGQFPGTGGRRTLPAPIAPGMVRGIAERMSARGNVLTQVDEASVHQAAGELLQAGVRVLAVCLVNAAANPVHELQIRAILDEVNDSIAVVLSHEVAPEAGEAGRALATVLNAQARAAMSGHRKAIAAGLATAEMAPSVDLALSAGGRTRSEQAFEMPVASLNAGRAAAATAAARIADLAGFPDALVLDMGGAAADIALVRGGAARISGHTAVGDDAIPVPSVDVRRVGGGGRSAARAPAPGAIRIARSARDTGPTVADANIVLGRLPAARIGIDPQSAEDAVAALANRLGLDRHRTAEGIVAVHDEMLAGEMRLMAVEKGEDPARMALVACGGAGPMHGCAIGAILGASAVVVPRHAGMMSPFGFLMADRTIQFAHHVGRTLDSPAIRAVAEGLADRANAWLADEDPDGTISYRADLRYRRGRFQVSTEVDADAFETPGGLSVLADRMADAHRRRFGMVPDQPVEMVALRVIARAGQGGIAPARHDRGRPDARAAQIDQAQVHFDDGFAAAAVYDRDRLVAGNRIAGPALILQSDTTTVVHPGHSAEIDDFLNIVIRPDGADGTGRPRS